MSQNFTSSQLSQAGVPQRVLPAWTMSLLLHTTLFVCGFFTLRVLPRGITEAPRGVGIVLANQNTEEASYFSPENAAAGAQSNSSTLSNTATAALALPGENAAPEVAISALPNANASGGIGFTELPTGNGNGNAKTTANSNHLGEATLQVFGVQGTGSRFVYVFDRSSSMSGYNGRPLAAAKRELSKSLASLEKVHQFQIIFYNEEPAMFRMPGVQKAILNYADTTQKNAALDFVTKIEASGGTAHLAPLQQALALQPDVIFFLTDANDPVLTAAELESVRRRNRSATVINTIEFGAGSQQGDKNFLHSLAEQNNGQHAYVDVTKLP